MNIEIPSVREVFGCNTYIIVKYGKYTPQNQKFDFAVQYFFSFIEYLYIWYLTEQDSMMCWVRIFNIKGCRMDRTASYEVRQNVWRGGAFPP